MDEPENPKPHDQDLTRSLPPHPPEQASASELRMSPADSSANDPLITAKADSGGSGRGLERGELRSGQASEGVEITVDQHFHDIVGPGKPVPRRIGPYQLLQRIGAGGMGDVWEAEQSAPVKRRVALKLIKQGVGSKEIIARFEAERQALALMNHSNIAQILDAGTTDDGHPYFVMELVVGQPLTTYCDERCLSIDERLKLFIDVCSGVQHAHQKGIIHRDLKPGNVIVGMQDGRPVPKVIDFGLAKAMENAQRLTDQSLYTGIGQILGTLKYMSPEQAGLDNLDIDTRTDIYALGVILYELLTGSTPLDDASIKGQAALKVLEFIREKEAVKPSSRLGSSTDEQVLSITGQRQTDSIRLQRILVGDLDWIVMKSLEKDRARRYESVSGLAADIHRYLQGEPVTARPPSVNYRVRKFVRKNRVGVTVALLLALTLMGGVVATSLAMLRALAAERLAEDRLSDANQARQEESAQRQLAEQRRREADRQRSLAETRREEAEQNLAYARKGNEILGSVFSALDPKAEYATVAELRNALGENLEDAVAELEGLASGNPLAVSELQMTLGRSLIGLGQALQAIELFKRADQTLSDALGPEHPDTLTNAHDLAVAYLSDDQLETALPMLEESLKRRKAILGPDHPDTLASLHNLASGYVQSGQLEKALPLFEATLKRRQAILGPEHADTLSSLNNLASTYRDLEQFDKALPLLEQVVKLRKATLGPDHPATLTSQNNLALAYDAAGQLEQAVPLFEQTLELRRARLGVDHPATLTSMNNLALGYRNSGQIDKALPLFERTLQLRIAKLGADHPATLTSMGNLARTYRDVEQFDKAFPLYQQAIELGAARLGTDHPMTLMNMNNLAAAYRAAGQLDRALPLMEQTLDLKRNKFGPEHPETLNGMTNLAAVYWSAGSLDRSVPLFEAAFAIEEKSLGRKHPTTQMTIANLGVNYVDSGKIEEGISLLEEAMESSKERPDLAAWVREQLADAYIKGKRTESFQSLANDFITSARVQFPEGSLELAAALVSTADQYLRLAMFRPAADLLREGTAIRNQHTADAWNTFNAQSMWGGALLGLAQHEQDEIEKTRLLTEAEPLLVAGYEGMKQRESIIPREAAGRITDALDRLIVFYTLLERPGEVTKYRDLRSQAPANPADSTQ